MGFRINNNISALVAQGNLQKTQRGLSRSIERLSSGLRINRGADDAAGLTISEKQYTPENSWSRKSGQDTLFPKVRRRTTRHPPLFCWKCGNETRLPIK